jgi:hypothetical protein
MILIVIPARVRLATAAGKPWMVMDLRTIGSLCHRMSEKRIGFLRT